MTHPRKVQTKLVPHSRLASLSGELKAKGKRIVTTNGCFDLLHWGHINYLNEARELGDVLIVGINSDDSVRGLKGSTRPLLGEIHRAMQIAALEAVDYVTIFDDATPINFISQVAPQIHVKGGDYAGKELPERAAVEGLGGKLAFLSLVEGLSTSNLIKKIKES